MKTSRATTFLLGLALALGAAGCTSPKLAQQKRVVYGERHDHELAYEFMQPRKTNGLGVVVMVSGHSLQGTCQQTQGTSRTTLGTVPVLKPRCWRYCRS